MTEASSPDRPRPAVTDLTRPFWDATRQGRLVIQRCAACRYYNHPPRQECDKCLSTDLAFEPVSGLGRVYSFTVMHQKNVQGFENSLPYLTALVELDEQPMLLLVTNLPGSEPSDELMGARARVEFQRIDDEITLPQFVIVGETK
jgi:uncharacterized OB-fold protein